jgi:hypothetical protein
MQAGADWSSTKKPARDFYINQRTGRPSGRASAAQTGARLTSAKVAHGSGLRMEWSLVHLIAGKITRLFSSWRKRQRQYVPPLIALVLLVIPTCIFQRRRRGPDHRESR